MKLFQSKQLFILLLTIFSLVVQAQHVHHAITCSGGTATGYGGTVSFTIGQLFFKTVTTEQGAIHEGIQKPFSNHIIDAIAEINDKQLLATVFPNPTSESLALRIKENELAGNNFSLQLLDMNGILLISKQISTTETCIEMHCFPCAFYMLRIFNSDSIQKISDKKKNVLVKTFKIIKN